MRSYWDLSLKDRAALTSEGVRHYIPVELMMAGVENPPPLMQDIRVENEPLEGYQQGVELEAKRHEELLEAVEIATSDMWLDWRKCIRLENDAIFITTTFDKYKKICGDEAKALKYLTKTFGEARINHARLWRSGKLGVFEE